MLLVEKPDGLGERTESGSRCLDAPLTSTRRSIAWVVVVLYDAPFLTHRVRQRFARRGRWQPMMRSAVFTTLWRALRSAAEQLLYQAVRQPERMLSMVHLEKLLLLSLSSESRDTFGQILQPGPLAWTRWGHLMKRGEELEAGDFLYLAPLMCRGAWPPPPARCCQVLPPLCNEVTQDMYKCSTKLYNRTSLCRAWMASRDNNWRQAKYAMCKN